MVTKTEPTLGQTIVRLEHELGLEPRELASALGVTTAMLKQWQDGMAVPDAAARQRLDELLALDAHLHETLKAEAIPRWLRRQYGYLGLRSPAELIGAGKLDPVEGLLVVIDYGMFT